ncbi:MAG: hypothetical protein ACTS7E_02865 [Arsenophonus sp. NC-CH8-MAG3]
MLGLNVHDISDYDRNFDYLLELDIVFSVELGLYISPDANMSRAYRKIGIRI